MTTQWENDALRFVFNKNVFDCHFSNKLESTVLEAILLPFMTCIQDYSPNLIMWEDFNKLLCPNYRLKLLSVYLQMKALQIGNYRPHL